MSFTHSNSSEITPLKLYFYKKKKKIGKTEGLSKAPALNMTAEERKTGTTLQRDLNGTILPADQGRCSDP